MTVPETARAKRKVAPRPRSAAEIVERLAAPLPTGKKPSPTNIVLLFKTKTRIPTSERERALLREHLARLDSTWAARATIVTHALPELEPGSTATLAHELMVEARTFTMYPDTGVTDHRAIDDWLDSLWGAHLRPGGRVMPWIALVSLWPDRHLPGFARALGHLLSGPMAFPRSKLRPALERLAAGIADIPRGTRLSEEIHELLKPFSLEAERISRLESDLANATKRSANARMEADAANSELKSTTEELAVEHRRAAESERLALEALTHGERRIAETEGRAIQRQAKTAQTFGLELRALAADVLMYLDRAEPNVEGALRRARELIDLGTRLEAHGS